MYADKFNPLMSKASDAGDCLARQQSGLMSTVVKAAVEAARLGSRHGLCGGCRRSTQPGAALRAAAKDTEGLIEESIGRSREGKTKVDRTAEAIRAISE